MVAAAAPARRISLDNVSDTGCVQPYRTLAYGQEKSGKTATLACAPGVIALDVENRMGHVSVKKFPQITTWQEALDALEALRVGKHEYKNVLVDSISYLEKLLKLEVMKASGWTAEEADEFQRWAKLAANSYWPLFFAACERLERERGMGILMTAHMQVKAWKNPGGEPYDRVRPSLCGDIGPTLVLHWCHDVLYFCFDDIARIEKRGGRDRVKTSTTGRRIAYTTHSPHHDAGNSCGLPAAIALPSPREGWEIYARLRAEGLSAPAQHARIEAAIPQISDADVKSKAESYYASVKGSASIVELRQIAERVEEIVASQSEAVTPDK